MAKFGKVCSKHPELNGLRAKDRNCPLCAKARNVAWSASHRELVNAGIRRHYWTNKGQLSEKKRADRVANPQKYKDRSRAYYEANKWRAKAGWAAREAAKIKATPAWSNRDIVNAFYRMAEAYRSSGVPCEVDHIVPLRHALVCGLHVEHNLQLLSPTANRSKGNKFLPG